MLSLAVGVALSPLPIIAVVLMLATPRARANGPAFLAGWILGLLVVGGVVLALSSGADASDGGAPATWVSWLKIALGALGREPKNLLLTVGAGAAIAHTDASDGAQVGALVVFAVVGTVEPGIPLAIYFGMGDRAATVLESLKG